MNRSKLLRFSIRLASSLTSIRQIGPNSLCLTQVNHFSLLTQSPPFSPQICYNPFNLHQKLFFSSKPESFIDLILSNDWSEKIEIELEKLNPKLTHESMVYVLMKLNGNPQKSLDFFKWVSVRKGFDPSYVPYTLLLKSLARTGFEKEFWVVALEMQEKGFYIDCHVYLNVHENLKQNKMTEDWTKFYKTLCDGYDKDDTAKYVVKSILESEWSEEVKDKLKKKVKFPLSKSFILRVLHEARRQPLRGLKFFNWVGSSGGCEHNSETYNAMLRLLASPDTVQEFWELVERMKIEGFEVDFDTLIRIFRHLPIEEAAKLFEIVMDGPYKPSLRECSMLLRSISQTVNPDIDSAFRVFNKLVAVGNTPSKKEYDGMHRILTKIGKFDEAKKIVQEMRDAGYEPDNTTYSQEIYGLCTHSRFEEACNVFDKMESEGCVPDIKTWTILLQGYCTAGQVDEALSCFIRMKEKNVDPDADTLDVLVNGFLSMNKLLGAYQLLVEMVKKGHIKKPWQATFQRMIEKLSEAGKLEEAFELVHMMRKLGHPPYADPVIRYISKFGTVIDAKKILAAITSKDAPSTAAYVRVIKSFVEAGRESEARDLIYSSPYRVRSNKEVRNMFGSSQTTNA